MNEFSALCDWLALVFATPVAADRLAAWRAPEAAAALRELGARAGLGPELDTALAALDAGPAALETAYHALFSGLAGPTTVAPYQSVHADEHGRLWQAPAAAMAALLARHDVHPTGPLANEPPDHIAVAFALLAELLRRGDAVACDGLLHAHLLPWVPGFARGCTAHDPNGFYAAAARLAARLLNVLATRPGPVARPANLEIPA